MTFLDQELFRASMLAKAVYDGASIRFVSSDKKRIVIKCALASKYNCKFHVRGSWRGYSKGEA